MNQAQNPSDLILTGNEEHALQQHTEPGDVVYKKVLCTTPDGRPAEKERLIGVVAEDRKSLTEPNGSITRLEEEHENDNMHLYFRLYPAGDTSRIDIRKVFPRRAELSGPAGDLASVRDVESFD